jgi:ABC-type branched-subunit amino acid transport system substrate-binding protein
VIALRFAFLVLAAAMALGTELTPQQLRGKRLYLTGESDAGGITALLGADQVEVAASVVPCAGCHGRDGRGKPEGGLLPSNLRWDVLLHPAAAGDRSRGPYTRSLLKRAVAMGLDANANPLQPAMPRYRMSVAQMDDLLAYLEILDRDREPGVSDDALRIGAVLPPGAAEQRAVRAALGAYFARINDAGGIFGRRIDPRFTSSIGSADERAKSLEAFIETERPFAIGAAWLSGADLPMSAVAERQRVPTIGAFAQYAPPSDRYVFRLLGGVREQSLALVAAAQLAPGARIAIHAADDATAALVRDDLAALGVRQDSKDADAILFLDEPSRLAPLLAAAAAAPAPPLVLIPAAHSAGDLTAAPAALDGRILVALPSSPDDVTAEGAAELRALAVAPEHATACRVALAAARLLVEALRRSGRDLDRDALVSTLESFYRVPTTFTPPVTWSRARHTGTRDMRIIAADVRRKRWIDRGRWPASLDRNHAESATKP